jgi:hypothetical protein
MTSHGSIHAEIMDTARGPVLVELNCRLHGGNGAWVRPAQTWLGCSHLSVILDVYLNQGAAFDDIPDRPVVERGECHPRKW